MNENDYMAGRRAAYRSILGECVRALGAEGAQADWIVEREEIRRALKHLAEVLDIDVDWPDSLHLADVIDKHIIPDCGEHASGSEWKPIETAPKDGTAILLLSKPYHVTEPVNGDYDVPAKVAIGHWKADGTSWVDEMGNMDGEAYTLAVTGVWLSGGGWFQPNEVTHWMPLPESF